MARLPAGCATLAALAIVGLAEDATAEGPAPPSTRVHDAPQATVEPRLGPLFHPDGPGEGRWRAAVGASIDILPRRLAESEQRPFPLLTGHLRYGLPLGFTVGARASAIYVSNKLELGVGWSTRLGPLGVLVQNHGGLWLGALGVEGFDAEARAVVDAPGVTVGLEIAGSRVSLAAEGLLTFARFVRLGDTARRASAGSPLTGVAGTVLVESPLGAKGELYYGVGVLWSQPQYEGWIAFSDARGRLVYPRLVAGYGF